MEITLAEWDEFFRLHSHAHFLQSGAWGELKSAFGWKPVRLVCGESGAQILFRQLFGGFCIGYIPKGPVVTSLELMAEVDRVCMQNRAIFLKVEPDQWEPDAFPINPGENCQPARPIQPRRTVLIPLAGSEEDILARMKQKTRYNIRLAMKKEVEVKPSSNVSEFYEIAKVTAQRDQFGVHSLKYYQRVYELFHPEGNCELLTAYYDSKPLASLFVFAFGDHSYYLYGASSDIERNRMPAYLIQWEAMCWAKQRGCSTYDLWGIPDLEEDELEKSFTHKDSHEGLWGVYRFKRGFGGETWRSVGACDRIYRKGMYALYNRVMRLRGSEGD